MIEMANANIHRNPDNCNKNRSIPIPKGAEFCGPLSDHVARFASRLMTMTACRKEFREKGYFIPFSSKYGRIVSGKNWEKVRKATVNEYSHIFEWNDRYSTQEGNSFCKSVRLRKEFRSGHSELYQFKRKRSTPEFNPDILDPTVRRLFEKLYEFDLPETPPEFENPWQAYTWDRVASKDHFGHRCDYGRFHSLMTSFKHRNMVHHPDGPVVPCDIKSCQPLILGTVIRDHCGMTPDLKEFFGIYRSGLYEFFADEMGVDRKTAKDDFIICIFERRKPMTEMPIFQAIENHFPTIAKYLLWKKKGNYKQVARACQTFESKLLINQVTPRLRGIPFVTIHDEFMAPEQYIPRIKEVILDVFKKHGVTPEFK